MVKLRENLKLDTTPNILFISDCLGETTYAAGDKFQSQPNKREIRPNPPTNPISSYIHNHFTSTDANGNILKSFPVFSGGDLYTVYNLFITDLSNFLMVVTTPSDLVNDPSDDTIYAVTISNTTDFENFGALFLSDIKVIDKIYRTFKINEKFSTMANEEKLARLLKKQKLGMSLYRGNKNDLTQWTRLKIKNNDQLKEDTCN